MARPFIQIVQKRLPAPPLMWRINMIVFSFTVVVLLYIFMIVPSPQPHEWIGWDLPRVDHAMELKDAMREDALIITVTRDGKVFFQRDQTSAAQLQNLVRDSLNRGSKAKIYFRVDARARTGQFMEAFDAVRPTGVQYIAFLAEQRRERMPR